MNDRYEIVIGLEVHAELLTETKIFCACPTAFGALPNTQICPVCIGLPGAMPSLNRRVVELAVMAATALHSTVSHRSTFDRKQYFYPDLPKGYQITQNRIPLARGGYLTITADHGEKKIGICRIHIEEDAGKLIHKEGETFVDCNRCGIPLAEFVSEPDLCSAKEASAYLRALRDILVTAGVSDCKMQEGSMRCDINLSVRKKGDTAFGTRTEIKNVNSFSYTEKAINYEAARQIEILERGGVILPETRRFDEATGTTVKMRAKEDGGEYRFLPEPDLPDLILTEEEISKITEALPILPREKKARFEHQFGLFPDEAETIAADPALASFFEAAATQTRHPKSVVNLLFGEILRVTKKDAFCAPVSPDRLAELCDLLGEGSISYAVAKKLLNRLFSADFSPREIALCENLTIIKDRNLIAKALEEAVAANPTAIADYQNGKKAALNVLRGRVMALTNGRAAPDILEELLQIRLEESL